MATRTEIDHLNTLDAFNALGTAGSVVGLGYNSGGVSYYWEAVKVRNGSVIINVEGRFTVRASLKDVTKHRNLPVCAFVSQLVQRKTGNCADTLCKLLGQ